jgi:hypothetical protein
VCSRCNRRKGGLSEHEFAELQNLVMRWPAEAQADIWRRLAMGGSSITWRQGGKGDKVDTGRTSVARNEAVA